jgi:SAM-dependent methyltransferase
MRRLIRSTVPIAAVCVATACMGGCASTERAGHGHGSHGGGHRHRGDIGEYADMLERPDREGWQKRDKVIAALRLKLGERVADVGCGPGYFAVPIASAVGSDGKVWAVDVEPKMLERTRQHATEAGVSNVELVNCAGDDPGLPAGEVDTILIVNTYHHFPNRPAYIAKLRAALAPGGRLVNIDFIPKPKEERGFGPPEWMQIPRAVVDAEMADAGLLPVRSHLFLPEQYFVEYSAK